MIYDVRNEGEEKIDQLVFADGKAPDGSYQASRIEPHTEGADVKLYDGSGDYVYVNSAEHARNLVKALNKAIELGWLK
jgi:hypothetical protein